MRNPIPSLIEKLTGQRRYKPTIEWASNSWTHNIFRAYELICWRQYGIRAESSVGQKTIQKNGKSVNVIVYEYHSFEALCAGTESYIRSRLSKFINMDFTFTLPYRLYIPVFQTHNGMQTSFGGSPYLFAIAFDATTAVTVTGGAGATHTFSHTCTGSDRILWVHSGCHYTGAVPGQTVNTVTYSAVSCTQAVALTNDGGNGQGFLHYLVAPATGANNVVVTVNVAGHAKAGGSTSFSGASQTGVPDATSTNTSGATTSYSQSVTSVADNCFAILGGAGFGGLTITGGSNTSIGSQPEVVYHGHFIAYSTSAKTPAGTFTLNVTSGSQGYGGVMASFKPAGGTDVTVNPSVQTCTFSIPAYTVVAERFVTVSGTLNTATFTIPISTQRGDVVISPSVKTATFSIPAYTVTADGSVTVNATLKTCTFTIPTYTVSIVNNVTISSSLQVCTFTIPAYTVTLITGVTVSATQQTATFSIPTYRVIADYWEDTFTQPADAWSDTFTQPANGWNDKY